MMTVLCIGGEPELLEMQKALLEASGHIVLTAPDGATAVVISRKRSVDVAVLDFNLAGMDASAILMTEQPTYACSLQQLQISEF